MGMMVKQSLSGLDPDDWIAEQLKKEVCPALSPCPAIKVVAKVNPHECK